MRYGNSARASTSRRSDWMHCPTDLDNSNSKQRAGTHERYKNYSVELRAQNCKCNLRLVAGFHYEVAAVAGFHYELKRPAATQPDRSTLLSCGLSVNIAWQLVPW